MVAVAKSIVAKEFIAKTLLTVLLFVSQVEYGSSWPLENEKRATSCHKEVKKYICHCIGNLLPHGEELTPRAAIGLLYPPPSLMSMYSIWVSVNSHWNEED